MTNFDPYRPLKYSGSQQGDDLRTLSAKIEALAKLTNTHGQPNINALWNIVKDIDNIKLTLKYFGFDLARSVVDALPPLTIDQPQIIDLKFKASTQADLECDWSRYWSRELKIAHLMHRKVWEFAFILQALHQSGFICENSRGIGFGCGEEPLPSYMASKGCRITATDLPGDHESAAPWAGSGQHATLDKTYRSEFLDRATFDSRVDFRAVDMNAIPLDLTGYDFCWSICAFEHLGSIDRGMTFIDNSMKTIRSGGVSIHTTEFNFLDDERTIDNHGTVLFQRKHFEEMANRLTAAGHRVAPLDFNVGNDPLDRFIDIPPFPGDWSPAHHANWSSDSFHLKLSVDGFAATCFGLIAFKG